MSRSVAIVGAGPGGLSAAMLMASAGADVTVYERGSTVGGRSGCHRFDGYVFDQGPTFFLYPHVLETIFEQCGFDLRSEVDLIRIDPLYRLVFEGEREPPDELQVWADAAKLAAAVQAFSPHDADGLRRFMDDNRTKLAAFGPVLSQPFSGLRDLFRPKVVNALRYLRPWASLDRDLARYFEDPRLRLAFSFQSKYLGMSPFRCPSLFSILSFLEHEHGVWHPRGGCHTVMDVMAKLAQRMGVRIELNAPVQQIEFDGRRARGVRVDGAVRRADAVVINADFAHAMSTLVPNALRRRWSDDALSRKQYSCSTFMLYLGIEGEVDLDHHTVLLAHDYARNLKEIESGTAPQAPSLYVQNASRTDDSLAPRGHSALYVLAPVGNLGSAPVDWSAIKSTYRNLIVERLQALGIHDLERRIRSERIYTPDDWAQQHAVFRGATFNLAHTLDQMLCWRPQNRFEDLDGVYLVGGGTHPGSGLPVIFEGARITSTLLTQDLGLTTRHPAPARGFAPGAWARP